MKQPLAFIALLGILSACAPQVEVQKIQNAVSLEPNAVVYALPKTVIDVEVTAQKTIIQRGPFYLFADKLGKTDVAARDKIEWTIDQVHIQQHTVPDSNQLYVIHSRNSEWLRSINLSEQGTLLGINTQQKQTIRPRQIPLPQQQREPGFINYSDLTTQSNVFRKVDTVYTGTGIDTLFLKVPSLRRQVVQRNIGEKAEEAANFIFELRRHRYELLFGEKKNLPDGQALESMLKKLDIIENQYLSLFVGRRIEQHYQYHFQFIPAEKGEITQHLLFRFSEARGVMPASSRIGTPIYLDSEKQNYSQSYQIIQQLNREAQPGLFYRQPDMAHIRILHDRNVIAQKELPVAQYGEIISLPADVLTNGTQIELYPQTGALKAIQSPR